ncbi:MAG TPA: CHAD domain-containing protein [Terracidiphilus sp.]|nr:CHAD domain-containing protein [Terracidiphilus sp.]
MQLERVQKPLRQMRKSLKRLSPDPPPETVHKLRTRARHIEAIAAALSEPGEKRAQRLLKSIKPVRKAAGNVRDMDVLTGNVLSLPQDGYRESLLRLVERLGIERQKSAGDLVDAVDQQRKAARRILKQYAKLVRSALADQGPGPSDTAQAHSVLHIRAVIQDRVHELSQGPTLTAHNLHPFRLKVKELRSILQLLPPTDPAANAALIAALGEVKDKIGEWHDWLQLAETARKILDPADDRALLKKIDQVGKQKFRQGLASANNLRKRYLRPPSIR